MELVLFLHITFLQPSAGVLRWQHSQYTHAVHTCSLSENVELAVLEKSGGRHGVESAQFLHMLGDRCL